MDESLSEMIQKYSMGFPTAKDFDEVESALETLCGNGTLEVAGIDPNTRSHMAIIYILTSREKAIRLSIPDQAFRGGIEWA